MKTVVNGIPFEGTIEEYKVFVESLKGFTKSKPSTSGKGNSTRTVLTEEEREQKRKEAWEKYKHLACHFI